VYLRQNFYSHTGRKLELESSAGNRRWIPAPISLALYRARFPHELKTSAGKHVTFASFRRPITRASFWQVCHGHNILLWVTNQTVWHVTVHVDDNKSYTYNRQLPCKYWRCI